jgi:hypothetical protein
MNRGKFPARTTAVAFALLLVAAGPAAAAAERVVQAATKPGEPWKDYPVRTLDEVPTPIRLATNTPLSRYGGWASRKLIATGFFYTTNLAGRWWFVDPDGCLFLNAGVASVKTIPSPGAREALLKRFKDEPGWAEATTALLRSNGFNSLGSWSDTEKLRRVTNPLPYTRIWNFMSGYGKRRGGTFQQPGHTGYPNDCIFVFDPAFETFCEEHARQLGADKDDPFLLGHFSDNEMPFKREALRGYLKLPEGDAGRAAAERLLRLRYGERATTNNITSRDEEDFLSIVVGRYYQIVNRSIKKHDPNHLFLGSRFYGSDLRLPAIFKAAGPHVDVISVNWYRAWTPDQEKLAMWTRESGRPVLITEWYAKGADSGMGNTGGAGWLVKTQRDRGLFYQNFTLALLESPSCVGWHWFRYSDNDPEEKGSDPSNRDSNKGIVNNRFETYGALLDCMKELNRAIYPLRASSAGSN